MKGRHEWREAVVTRAEGVAEGVRKIDFAISGEMPAFEPGCHTTIEVDIAGIRAERSYTCLPAERRVVRVAVKRHEKSRGGSRFMWALEKGAKVRLTVPENRFELSWRAPAYLLIAGGIGITPMVGMANALVEKGRKVRLAYSGQLRAAMAFADELQSLMGEQAEIFETSKGRRLDLQAEIAALPAEGELYVCGPIGLLNDAKAAWARAGRSPSRFRFEVFGDSGEMPELPFRIEVANSDICIDVAADQSMLDALTAAGVDMIWDCLRGECGLCAVEIVELEGEIDHRDVFLSKREKEEKRRLCSCVSRLAGGRAVIDTGYRKT